MTNDDIIRMAREVADLDKVDPVNDGLVTLTFNEMQRFAELVAAAEREACANVCDEQEKRSRESSEKARRERDQFMYHHCAVTAKWNAAAIRARGQG